MITPLQFIDIYERASCVMIHATQCLVLLPEVCEYAVSLEKKIKELEGRLENLEGLEGKPELMQKHKERKLPPC